METSRGEIQAFEFIKNMVDCRTFACVIWDFNGTFVYANEKFCDLLGYSLDEITSLPFDKLIYHKDVAESFAVYETNMELGGVAMIGGFYNRYKRKDGKVIWIRWEVAFNDKERQMGSGEVNKMNWLKSLWLTWKYRRRK